VSIQVHNINKIVREHIFFKHELFKYNRSNDDIVYASTTIANSFIAMWYGCKRCVQVSDSLVTYSTI